LDFLLEFGQILCVLRLGPGIHRAFLDGLGTVRNHQIHIEIDGVAEALAAFAGAERSVEAEQSGLGGDEFLAALLAAELLVKPDGFAAARRFEKDLARFAIADLDGVHQALAGRGRN
jgi:hypothetical protein